MILVLTPHGDWLITNKGASPLEYAQVTLNPNQSTDQLKGLASYLLGLIKQYFLFAIFMLGAWIWRLKENERQAAAYQSISPFATSVMLHLTVGRALLMVLIALAGVRLQDHWAMPLALFMSLPIACYTRRQLGPLKNRHLNSLFFVQVIAVGFFTLQNLGYLKQQNVAHIERHLSVDNIVIATQKHWRKSTNCELHTLQGDPELTALYAAYSKENLRRVPDDWFDKNGGDEAMSKGVVRLHYKDRQGDRHDKFDDAFVVGAYDDRHGLPDRKVEVQFSYPKTSCR
jgi:hypothetical protein